MYLPVSVAGFIIYGSDVNSNILQSIPNGAMRTTAEIFITFNVMFAFLIVLNPFSQDMEELFGIPHSKYSIVTCHTCQISDICQTSLSKQLIGGTGEYCIPANISVCDIIANLAEFKSYIAYIATGACYIPLESS